MSSTEAERSLQELSEFHSGLAHPTRVAILRILRKDRELTTAELRRRVAEAHEELDTRTLQHHLYKMQVAGLLTVGRGEGGERARLLRDIQIVVRPVPR